MDVNENVMNEEVMETEETNETSGNGIVGWIIGGVAAIGAGIVLGTKVIKPWIEKRKARKEALEVSYLECDSDDEVESE